MEILEDSQGNTGGLPRKYWRIPREILEDSHGNTGGFPGKYWRTPTETNSNNLDPKLHRLKYQRVSEIRGVVRYGVESSGMA